MSDILFQYHKIDPTTWVYVSSLLTIGLFFKFSRLWSIRNLDLILLILFAPGLVLIDWGVKHSAPLQEQAGYIWLLAVTLIWLVRMLLDPLMVRRPLLEPNLSPGGMVFIGVALLVFLMANVVNSNVTREDLAAAAGKSLPPATAAPEGTPPEQTASPVPFAHGPGYPLLYLLPRIPTHVFIPRDLNEQPGKGTDVAAVAAARTMAITAHLMIVIGIVLIGYRHFDNLRSGIAAALLYLLLPYTAQLTGRVDHVLPAALLVWAIEAYRRPFVAGIFIGLAAGTIYYPMFLLPLWLSFYWQRGFMRFGLGVLAALGAMALGLLFVADSPGMFFEQLKQMFGWPALAGKGAEGFWSFDLLDPVWRIPVVAAFFVLSASFALWPAQKNLGTLMSCSAAVMLAAQFWNPNSGGLYMGWYLPLVLLTVFRLNLEDRVALSVLGEGWRGRPRPAVAKAS